MKVLQHIETKDVGSKDLVFATTLTTDEIKDFLKEQDKIFCFHIEEYTTDDGYAVIRLIPDRGMAIIVDGESILLAHDGGGGKVMA